MLQPKRTKFRKMHKGRACGIKKQNLHFKGVTILVYLQKITFGVWIRSGLAN